MRIQAKRQNTFIGLCLFSLFLFSKLSPAFAESATLSWAPNTDSDLSGYKIYYGTASRRYETPINVGKQTAYTLTELGPGTYYFALTAYDTSGTESAFSTEVSKTFPSATSPISDPTADLTPPADVLNFSAVAADRTITLQWTNPPDADFAGVHIRYRTDRYPSDLNDGELLGEFTGSPDQNMTTVQSGLENQVTYYYSASSYDSHGNYQSTAHASASPFTLSSPSGDGPNPRPAGGGGCAMIFPRDENLPGVEQSAEIAVLLGVLFGVFLKKKCRFAVHRFERH